MGFDPFDFDTNVTVGRMTGVIKLSIQIDDFFVEVLRR